MHTLVSSLDEAMPKLRSPENDYCQWLLCLDASVVPAIAPLLRIAHQIRYMLAVVQHDLADRGLIHFADDLADHCERIVLHLAAGSRQYGRIGIDLIAVDWLEHDPEKWIPVFRKIVLKQKI